MQLGVASWTDRRARCSGAAAGHVTRPLLLLLLLQAGAQDASPPWPPARRRRRRQHGAVWPERKCRRRPWPVVRRRRRSRLKRWSRHAPSHRGTALLPTAASWVVSLAGGRPAAHGSLSPTYADQSAGCDHHAAGGRAPTMLLTVVSARCSTS